MTQTPIRRIICMHIRGILCLVTVLAASRLQAEWMPPADPNPKTILDEAREDTQAKRYEDALAKHVWYHENALRLQPAQMGVRLSFALNDWIRLGKLYPPALEKLKSIRDKNAETVKAGRDAKESFEDFSAINDHLEDADKTKNLFVWLDAHQAKTAKELFDEAMPALIKAKEYKLCGKYLVDAEGCYQQYLESYKRRPRSSPNPETAKLMAQIWEENFSNDVATLVALLELNGRRADAEAIVAEALEVRSDSEFKAVLDKALEGQVPEPR